MLINFLIGVATIVLLIYVVVIFWRRQKRSRRRRLFNSAFPLVWSQFLREDFPLYSQLPDEIRGQLEGRILVFLDEKIILGRNGQLINDRVKLLIAAQACLLIVNKMTNYYPGFKTILVYPEPFVVNELQHDGLLQSNVLSVRAGESWHRGPVVLAWSQVLQGASNTRDGHNVVLHEFAHKLDEQNNAMDGLPILPRHSQYASWAKVLNEEFEEQKENKRLGHADVIDSYGAQSPAEFFAVVTEVFFERPKLLSTKHPKLYEQFKLFYEVDPITWELQER